MPDLREKVARIVDPEAFDESYGTTVYALLAKRRETALTKADAILEALEVGWRTTETPGAKEAFKALDVADRLIERGYGVDVPKEWNAAFRSVAKARSKALPTPPEVK